MVPVVTRPEQVREPVRKVHQVVRIKPEVQRVTEAAADVTGAMEAGRTMALVPEPAIGVSVVTTVLAHTAVMVAVPK